MSFASTVGRFAIGTAVLTALAVSGAAPASSAPDQTEQIMAGGASTTESKATAPQHFGYPPDVESIRAVYDGGGSSLPQTTTEFTVAAAVAGGLLTTGAAAVFAGRRKREAVEA